MSSYFSPRATLQCIVCGVQLPELSGATKVGRRGGCPSRRRLKSFHFTIRVPIAKGNGLFLIFIWSLFLERKESRFSTCIVPLWDFKLYTVQR